MAYNDLNGCSNNTDEFKSIQNSSITLTERELHNLHVKCTEARPMNNFTNKIVSDNKV